jgi:hypothetical protein
MEYFEAEIVLPHVSDDTSNWDEDAFLADVDWDNWDNWEEDECDENSVAVKTESRRFPVSELDIDRALIERTPKNTMRSTSWGVRVFEAWCHERKIEETVESMEQ